MTGYVLTNRMNLNTILSTRVIGPRGLYAKYYPDLMELTGGEVAVLAEPPDSELAASVCTTTRTGPVVLEVELTPTNAVDLSPALPLSRTVAIHLPDQRAAREHRARRYANIHPHLDLLRVTPEMFAGRTSAAQVGAATAVQQDRASTADWARVDRLRGGCAGAVAAADSRPTLMAAALLLPGSQARQPVAEWLRGDVPATAETSVDDRVLLAALDVLAATDVTESWDPNAVVEAVRVQVGRAEISSFDRTLLDRVCNAMGLVLRGERPFVSFRSSSADLRSARALLLVLLRPRMGDLLAWGSAESGADAVTTQRAALLAGVLRGLAREDCATRSVTLDDLTAAWFCGERSTECPTVAEDGTGGLVLIAAGLALQRVPTGTDTTV